MTTPAARTRPRRRRGLSIVEMLVALAISALLLAAVMVAINASFHAYATAAESASTQAASRMVMMRLMTMIRNGNIHDAYDPSNASLTLGDPLDEPVRSVGIQMLDRDGRLVRVWWAANPAYLDPDLGDLLYAFQSSSPVPLLEMVRCRRDSDTNPFVFTLASRDSDAGLLLSRATVDLTIEIGADGTLSLEAARGASAPVRLVSSAAPRRNLP